MYYVSGINNRIAVTDTDDGVTEWLDEKTLYNILNKGIHVYGAFKYNYKPECTVLAPRKVTSGDQLRDVLREYDKCRNNHTVHRVEDFLAMCEVGVVINARYRENGVEYHLEMRKQDIDKWFLDCPMSIEHNMLVNSVLAAHTLTVYYHSSGSLSLSHVW